MQLGAQVRHKPRRRHASWYAGQASLALAFDVALHRLEGTHLGVDRVDEAPVRVCQLRHAVEQRTHDVCHLLLAVTAAPQPFSS